MLLGYVGVVVVMVVLPMVQSPSSGWSGQRLSRRAVEMWWWLSVRSGWLGWDVHETLGRLSSAGRKSAMRDAREGLPGTDADRACRPKSECPLLAPSMI